MNSINIIKNFFSKEECEFYINYIETNIDKFQQTKTSKRYVWLFGDEISMVKNKGSVEVNLDLSPIADIEPRVRKLFIRVENKIKDTYKDDKDLFVTSFVMTKQVPGAFITPHYDTDGGVNHYFKYSGIIYLNTMKEDGFLEFPSLGYSYSPEAGDLLMFPSADPESLHKVATISEDRYSLPIWLTEDASWRIK